MIAVLIGVSAALTSVRGVWAEEVFAAAWQRLTLMRVTFGGGPVRSMVHLEGSVELGFHVSEHGPGGAQTWKSPSGATGSCWTTPMRARGSTSPMRATLGPFRFAFVPKDG